VKVLKEWLNHAAYRDSKKSVMLFNRRNT
jgi:hypothetical protein